MKLVESRILGLRFLDFVTLHRGYSLPDRIQGRNRLEGFGNRWWWATRVSLVGQVAPERYLTLDTRMSHNRSRGNATYTATDSRLT